jgi:hypothetical protein
MRPLVGERVPHARSADLARDHKSLAGNHKIVARLSAKRRLAMTNSDYYLVTSRRGEHPERWSWEIRRKSIPLGIKLSGDGYQSDSAAQVAGKRALDEFLSELAKEERRDRC